jgi:hypothetical protein
MRREITAINAMSMAIGLLAGAVLCMHVAQLRQLPALDVSERLLSIIEVVIFGAAVYIWRPTASLGGWVGGVTVMVIIRLALAWTAVLGLTMADTAFTLPQALARVSTTAPRFAAVLFSLMAGYPLRSLVPTSASQSKRRFAGSPAVRSAAGPQADGDSGLLIVTVKDRAATGVEPPKAAQPTESSVVRPVLAVALPIEVPLSALLAELPREMVTDKARQMSDGRAVVLPADSILPQLAEAQVRLGIHEFTELLPSNVRKALLSPSDISLEFDQVDIPLELIVPQLPADAFALAPASPPEWADVDETDGIVFATV